MKFCYVLIENETTYMEYRQMENLTIERDPTYKSNA